MVTENKEEDEDKDEEAEKEEEEGGRNTGKMQSPLSGRERWEPVRELVSYQINYHVVAPTSSDTGGTRHAAARGQDRTMDAFC